MNGVQLASAPTLERIVAELDDLKRRVARLEESRPSADSAPAAAAATEPAAPTPAYPAFDLPGGAMAVIGTAVLGLAGGYLLRALSESGSFPRSAVVAIALGYAAAWLVMSVRTRSPVEFAGAMYASTAALVLFPMLWETTVRFQVMPAPATAGLLVAFVVLASVLAWAKNFAAVMWTTTIAACLTAIALAIGTRDLPPFALALAAIAAVVETAACRDHWPSIRPAVALAADAVAALLIFLATRTDGLPPGYKPFGKAAVLLLPVSLVVIYAAAVVYRTIRRRLPITAFETAQTAGACALAITAAVNAGEGAVLLAFGAVCLGSASACYYAAFVRFEHDGSHRNYHAYAAYGQALAMIGSWLLLPGWVLAPLWCVGAVLAIVRSMRTEHVMPGLQGAVYVIAAAQVSGLLDYARHAFTGAFPPAPDDGVIVAALGALVAYGLWARTPPGDWCRAARVPFAALAACAVTALLLGVIVGLFAPGASTVGAIRTLVISLAALALGYAGSHWNRRELVIVAYAAVALGSLKVVLEDWRNGTPAAFAISLLCYGAVLIMVPRMVRRAS